MLRFPRHIRYQIYAYFLEDTETLLPTTELFGFLQIKKKYDELLPYFLDPAFVTLLIANELTKFLPAIQSLALKCDHC